MIHDAAVPDAQLIARGFHPLAIVVIIEPVTGEALVQRTHVLIHRPGQVDADERQVLGLEAHTVHRAT